MLSMIYIVKRCHYINLTSYLRVKCGHFSHHPIPVFWLNIVAMVCFSTALASRRSPSGCGRPVWWRSWRSSGRRRWACGARSTPECPDRPFIEKVGMASEATYLAPKFLPYDIFSRRMCDSKFDLQHVH